jgi:mRNA-degrading endonuclease RelE of RelBE toxin-antitoxin system
MPRTIVLAPEALEDLNALRAYDRAAVRDALERHLRHEPTKTNKRRIKELRGVHRPRYRLRVDEVRIFYDVVDDVVAVLVIMPKASATAWLARYAERDADLQRNGDGVSE